MTMTLPLSPHNFLKCWFCQIQQMLNALMAFCKLPQSTGLMVMGQAIEKNISRISVWNKPIWIRNWSEIGQLPADSMRQIWYFPCSMESSSVHLSIPSFPPSLLIAAAAAPSPIIRVCNNNILWTQLRKWYINIKLPIIYEISIYDYFIFFIFTKTFYK